MFGRWWTGKDWGIGSRGLFLGKAWRAPFAVLQSFASVEELVQNYQSEKLVLYSGGEKTGRTLLTTSPPQNCQSGMWCFPTCKTAQWFCYCMVVGKLILWTWADLTEWLWYAVLPHLFYLFNDNLSAAEVMNSPAWNICLDSKHNTIQLNTIKYHKLIQHCLMSSCSVWCWFLELQNIQLADLLVECCVHCGGKARYWSPRVHHRYNKTPSFNCVYTKQAVQFYLVCKCYCSHSGSWTSQWVCR